MIKHRLFSPGPTDVPPEVLGETARPMFHHRTDRFRKMFVEVNAGLRKILQTRNDVLTIAGSGTAGVEAAIACLVPRDKKVLVANGGKFGERWVKVAKVYGLDVDEVVLQWGTALQPKTVKEKLATGAYGAVIVVHSETCTATACDLEAIAKEVAATDAILLADCITAVGALPLKTDQWEVDVVAVGSQKALMLPPGLAAVAVSDKAWKVAEAIEPPCFYLNLKAYRKSAAGNDTPYTPAVSLFRGLKVALDMINETGIEKVWARTARLAEATRTAAEAIGIKVFSHQPSDSVTGLVYPDGVGDDFRKRLQATYGMSVAGGQAQLKGKIFRVSHMGYVDLADTIGLIAAIEYTLADVGVDVEIGKGVVAAARVLKGWR
ncbi:MAG: alanine--glyoxylate aminotransferase family protein [Phycisphaerae bacterium]|jgi:aspartate aminotransferase-like enzyme|nr:alanine--glyoxylate aminotransferase family protein [Phycisphaerae bacterium]MDP7636645.1 alanine--glyoxylate aminotransferase family protein [Phycisphaerae bacterium]